MVLWIGVLLNDYHWFLTNILMQNCMHIQSSELSQMKTNGEENFSANYQTDKVLTDLWSWCFGETKPIVYSEVPDIPLFCKKTDHETTGFQGFWANGEKKIGAE